jgi:pimeloyl-ACP methyl ester carboxylesterase
MEHVKLADGSVISYDLYGSGPPLILIHGALTDHKTNWPAVKDLFGQRFTVYAVARRGRGETTALLERSLEDEFGDIAALIQSVGQPSFVLGHSGGAHIALGGVAARPELVSKLVLYEPPAVDAAVADLLPKLEEPAKREDWQGFVRAFMLEAVRLPVPFVDAMKTLPIWPAMVADGPATYADIRSLVQHKFNLARFAVLEMPVLFLVGSESPREGYHMTDAISAVLPNSQVVELQGQGHIAHQLAPQMFVETVSKFLLG